MTQIADATAIRPGSAIANRVYLGSILVWSLSFDGFDLWDDFANNENPLTVAPSGQSPIFLPTSAAPNWIALDGYVYLEGGFDKEFVIWDIGSPNQYAETEFLDPPGANLYPAIMARSNDNAFSTTVHYRVEGNQSTGGISIMRVISTGAQSGLQYSASGLWVAGDTIGIEVKDDVNGNPVIKGFINGVERVTFTDSSVDKITSGNFTGFRNGVGGGLLDEYRFGSIRAKSLDVIEPSGFGNNFGNDFGGPA